MTAAQTGGGRKGGGVPQAPAAHDETGPVNTLEVREGEQEHSGTIAAASVRIRIRKFKTWEGEEVATMKPTHNCQTYHSA